MVCQAIRLAWRGFFSCYRAVGRVEKLLDTRRAVRPAKSGFRFDSFAARPDYTFSGLSVRKFCHFSPALPKLFHSRICMGEKQKRKMFISVLPGEQVEGGHHGRWRRGRILC